MLDNPLAIPVWKEGCIDQIVFLEETNEVYKYSFSNSLEEIQIAIFARTGHKINLDYAKWILNPELSISVKHSMNSHNANFSMTIDKKDKINYIVVNMRVGTNWFITGYSEFKGKYISWDTIRTLSKIRRMIEKVISLYEEESDDD